MRLALFALAILLAAAGQDISTEPEVFTYREIEGRTLSAHVFSPAGGGPDRPADAILLFHGGGWSAGSPEWTFDAARGFAASGLMAISAEYRLAEGDVTPIEALEDVCAAFAWTRRRSDALHLTGRVAGYGVSAGGHLVASTMTIGCPEDADGGRVGPEALLLWSPALDLHRDGWFLKKLRGRATAADLSPAEHVRSWTPPTSIVIGAKDTLTPLAGARKYCDRLIESGGICELHVYDDLGHLLTRNLANQESDFDPDPEARADGISRHLRFLEKLGFTR